METLTEQALRLRQQVQRQAAGRGRRFPPKLRAKLKAHADARQAEGASLRAIGSELGMSDRTLWYWLRGGRQKSREDKSKGRATKSVALKDGDEKLGETEGQFLPVKLVEATVNGQASIVVHGPGGVRVEGLDLPALAELLRRLS